MFIILFVSQALSTIIILAVLWVLFDRELWVSAMEKVGSLRWVDIGKGASDIMIVAACCPNDKRMECLKKTVSSFCPSARIEVIFSGNILGGVIIRCGEVVEDFSMMGRLDYLRGGA